jgi:hypothetical protein
MPNFPELLQHLSQSASEWSVPLAFAWAGWMTVGLALSFWWKRQTEVVVAPAYVANWDATPSPSVRPRPKSGSKITPAVVKPQQPKGDAFSELQAMLDAPGNEDVTN